MNSIDFKKKTHWEAFHPDAVSALFLTAGFFLRLTESFYTYLNPDEAMHFWWSLSNGFYDLLQRAAYVHHPPLLIILTHYIGNISQSELAIRIIPIISGSLFPLFIYLWLGRITNKQTGLLALTILVFAPNIIHLSAQLRSYTPALFFMSVILYLLDRAIDEMKTQWLLLSSGFLYLGILTDYSFVFFTAVIGIYFLLRIWDKKPPRKLITIWLLIQIGGLLCYGALYFYQVKGLLNNPSKGTIIEGYLKGAFPLEGENLFSYFAAGTIKQFAYVFASIPGGVIMGVFFLYGLVLLWQYDLSCKWTDNRILMILLVLPFLFLYLSGIFHIYPYGRSRHTVFLAIFIAAGCAIALERLLGTKIKFLIPVMILVIPIWFFTADADQGNIERTRHHRKKMLAAIEYIQQTIPVGSLIFADGETRYLLNYYLGPDMDHQINGGDRWDEFYSYYQIYSKNFHYSTQKDLIDDLISFKKENVPPKKIWFIDGGFNVMHLEKKEFSIGFSKLRNFKEVLLIYEIIMN